MLRKKTWVAAFVFAVVSSSSCGLAWALQQNPDEAEQKQAKNGAVDRLMSAPPQSLTEALQQHQQAPISEQRQHRSTHPIVNASRAIRTSEPEKPQEKPSIARLLSGAGGLPAR